MGQNMTFVWFPSKCSSDACSLWWQLFSRKLIWPSFFLMGQQWLCCDHRSVSWFGLLLSHHQCLPGTLPSASVVSGDYSILRSFLQLYPMFLEANLNGRNAQRLRKFELLSWVTSRTLLCLTEIQFPQYSIWSLIHWRLRGLMELEHLE